MGEYMMKVRLGDARKEWLDGFCAKTGMTMSEVVKTLFDAIDNNRIEIRDGEVVATGEMLDILRPADSGIEYEELGFAGVLRLMRKNDYPDSVIRKMNEQHMVQVSDAGRYNPKKFRDEAC